MYGRLPSSASYSHPPNARHKQHIPYDAGYPYDGYSVLVRFGHYPLRAGFLGRCTDVVEQWILPHFLLVYLDNVHL